MGRFRVWLVLDQIAECILLIASFGRRKGARHVHVVNVRGLKFVDSGGNLGRVDGGHSSHEFASRLRFNFVFDRLSRNVSRVLSLCHFLVYRGGTHQLLIHDCRTNG